MTELKPCPFCGGEADIYDDRNATYSVRAFGECRNVVPTYYKCYCKSCGACGSVAKVEADRFDTFWQIEAKSRASEAWNRRVDND